MSVKMRQLVEQEIAAALLTDALAAGYSISIDNGGGEEEETRPSRQKLAILKNMFQTDQEHLYLWKDGKRIGWVFFVYGNDGWDVISDYTTNLEHVMTGANAVSAKYE